MDLQTYKLSIPANSTINFPVTGNFIRVDSATGNLQIKTDSGDRVIVRVGKTLEISPFTMLRITDLSGVDQDIILEAGDGKVLSQELSGVVSIAGNVTLDHVNSGVVLNGESKFIVGANYSPGAGNYGYTELTNPSDSGIYTVIVGFGAVPVTAALASLMAFKMSASYLNPTEGVDNVNGSGTSKTLYVQQSSASSRTELSTDRRIFYRVWPTLIWEPLMVIENPIVLFPGESLLIRTLNPAIQFNMHLEFSEVSA